MRAAGLAPDSVDTVILSHLHFDHVGSAEAFVDATFVAGLGERARSDSRMDGFEPAKLAWIRQGAWREIDFGEGTPYATFDRSFDLFGDASIILIAGGGHTEGGMAALLQLPRGPVLLAHDRILYPYHKWFMHELVRAEDEPDDLMGKLEHLLADHRDLEQLIDHLPPELEHAEEADYGAPESYRRMPCAPGSG